MCVGHVQFSPFPNFYAWRRHDLISSCLCPVQGRGSTDVSPRRCFSTQTYCPVCCNWFPAARPLQFAVKNNNSYCVECLASIFPFNGIVDDLEFRVAIKGLRFLQNFDYLRVQSDTSLIITRPHIRVCHMSVKIVISYTLACTFGT